MTTTALIARWSELGSTSGQPALDIVTAVAADFTADFDLDAAARDLLHQLNAALPDGYRLAANGDVYGPAGGDARVIEQIRAAAEGAEVDAILQAHEKQNQG